MSQPQWTADIHIDAVLAQRLIADQFAELRDASVVPFGVGWDNAAFFVDGRLIFRFPRRRAFAKLIAREIAILPQLAPHLPLAISSPLFLGEPSEPYPWAFAGYPVIEGRTACSTELDDDARVAFAAPLAVFLRTLHGMDVAPLVERGLPLDELKRLDHDRCMKNARERVAYLASAGAIDRSDAIIDWLESHPPRLPDPGSLTMVHGDLYARHVILGDEMLPIGIIDWGDMHLGDRALDLSIAHLMLPACAHAIFRKTYGEIDEPTWIAARYRATYAAILELDYGFREKDDGMRRIGAAALRLMERSA